MQPLTERVVHPEILCSSKPESPRRKCSSHSRCTAVVYAYKTPVPSFCLHEQNNKERTLNDFSKPVFFLKKETKWREWQFHDLAEVRSWPNSGPDPLVEDYWANRLGPDELWYKNCWQPGWVDGVNLGTKQIIWPHKADEKSSSPKDPHPVKQCYSWGRLTRVGTEKERLRKAMSFGLVITTYW